MRKGQLKGLLFKNAGKRRKKTPRTKKKEKKEMSIHNVRCRGGLDGASVKTSVVKGWKQCFLMEGIFLKVPQRGDSSSG